MPMTPSKAAFAVALSMTSCTTAAPVPAPATGWDSLCPTTGVSAPVSIVASEDVPFEPSGAAVFGGRVAVIGDKQTALWWWTPGTTTVEHDTAWAATPADAATARSCCASSAEATWGTPLKRQKARETCDVHGVPAGTAVPWLKGEALASTSDDVFVAGNAFEDATLGLSDLAVLSDGRLLASVSIERTVAGKHEVGGVVLVTNAKEPWKSLGTWPTTVVARFDDHKPEGVVALTSGCAAVIFDDDEKVKLQRRGASAEWASRAAFVRYLRLLPYVGL